MAEWEASEGEISALGRGTAPIMCPSRSVVKPTSDALFLGPMHRSLVLLTLAACGHATTPPREQPPAAHQVASAPPAERPPGARSIDVTETLFGVTVSDPYRWMEAGGKELDDWLRAQGAYTEKVLASIGGREQLRARVRALGLGTSNAFGFKRAGGLIFYKEIGAGQQLPRLMVRGASGAGRVLVDPEALGSGRAHASVNSFAPSRDGTLVAYDLSLGGSEISEIHILDVATGKDLPEVIPRIWGELTAAWLPDGKAFFYTQMAAPAEGVDPLLNMTVRLHRLGEQVGRDVTILAGDKAKGFPLRPEEFSAVWVPASGKWMIAGAGGAHNEIRVAVAPLASLDTTGAMKTPWRSVAEYADGIEKSDDVEKVVDIHGDRLYLMTFHGAPNKRIVSVPLSEPVLAKAVVDVPEAKDAAIVSFVLASDALYVERMVSGRAEIDRRPWKGKPAIVALPYAGWVDELASDPQRDGVVLSIQGWTHPPALYAYSAQAKALEPTGIAATSNGDFKDIVTEEIEVASTDGTRVPLSILHQKEAMLDGSHPVIVFAYGGYGYSQTPSFDAARLAWLERGGVFAVCHVRGGGEKGYAWQVGGSHEHKMNGVRDFEACGQHLIDAKYTSGARLFGVTGSLGGVLVGRAITDRPELYAGVEIAAGLVNPLRILAAENGANQKVELGDPETRAGFTSILEIDPYQHVQAGTAYPAVLFTIGLNDYRVAPWMTGKLAARMLAANTSGKPVLVRVESDAGHGIGSTRDQEAAETADAYAFFLSIAGDPAFVHK
jgi:prolyl oligopeptidase